MNRKFNLLEEEWLPCITKNGHQKEFGIRQILQQAPDIREMYGDTPLTTIALHRLLLAVLYTVLKISGLKVWQTFWQQKQWPGEPLDAYFQTYYDRFYLLSDKHPFYQITDEHIARIKRQLSPNSKKHEPETISILAEDRASGQNKTLFDHTIDGLALSPAEAARRLVTTQVYSLSSSSSGVPGVPNYAGPCTRGMVFLIEGENLFETLMFNLILYTEDRPIPVTGDDRPVWELDEPPAPDQSQPNGYLDYLTWQNRRIKLLPEEENGQLTIRQVYIFPGRGLDKSVEDPMMAFKRNKKDERKEIRLNPSRALWRDSTALLALTHPGKERLCPDALNWVSIFVAKDLIEREKLYHLKAFGLKTKQGGLIEMQRQEQIPLPVELLKNEDLPPILRSALKTAERFGSILRNVERTLLVELGLLRMEDLKNFQQVEKAHNIFKLTYLYWSHLEGEFQQFIRDLPNNSNQALAAWQQTLLQCVRATFREGTATLIGIAGNSKALATAHNQLEGNLWAIRKNWQSIEQEETFEVSETSKV